MHLRNAFVHIKSECAHDTNSDAYRLTRLVDTSGKGVNVKVWGDMAADEATWEKKSILTIHNSKLNLVDGRVDVRMASAVERTGEAGIAGAGVAPSRLTMVALQRKSRD